MTHAKNNAAFLAKDEHTQAFSEVVQSSLQQFTGQCWQWDTFPPFASLVSVQQKETEIIGLVSSISTGSMDPARFPIPYQKTEEELRTNQPQIFEFLKTTFTASIVGSVTSGKLTYRMVKKPCKIHSFIRPAPARLIKAFFARPDFLHVLFGSDGQELNVDEMLLNILDNLQAHKLITTQLLESYYNTFSLLTGNDYRRMKTFLARAQNVLNS